jgi:hypothetical protein
MVVHGCDRVNSEQKKAVPQGRPEKHEQEETAIIAMVEENAELTQCH